MTVTRDYPIDAYLSSDWLTPPQYRSPLFIDYPEVPACMVEAPVVVRASVVKG